MTKKRAAEADSKIVGAVPYGNETEFEEYLRRLIEDRITKVVPSVYALRNKKAVDIVICKDKPKPELFFLEVKFHQKKNGRLGFGGGAGRGFQPEILSKHPAYFEENLRWILASDDHEPSKVLFVPSATVRKYVAGKKVDEKYNNIQKRIFREERWLDADTLVQKLRSWLGVSGPRQET